MLPNRFDLPVRNYSSLAALVFLLLEYFSNICSEYTYIWRARPTVVKYIYLISRYLCLIGLIVNHVLIHLFPIGGVPIRPELCRVWYLSLFGVCAIMLATLDAILLLRVYALYMYKKNVKVHILAVPIILQFIITSLQMERVSRYDNFNSYCNKPTSLRDVGFSGGSVVIAHTSLYVATFAKRNVAEGRAVVVRLVVREGAWVAFSLIGIVAAQATYAVVSHSSSPFAFFVWPTALLSVITCKIILNMNKLKIEQPQQRDNTECSLSTLAIEYGSRDIPNEEV